MTRLELLKILVGQARTNGFEFRKWYTTCLQRPWQNADAAFVTLAAHRQYYALLFSHEFAQSFWKAGATITFQMPARTFQRRMADGSIGTVSRKPYMRRTGRPDVWRYHLREMALAEEPLRYMRKYLRVEEELEDAPATPALMTPAKTLPVAKPATAIPATLVFARRAQIRREREAAKLPPLPATPSASRRGARAPGPNTAKK